MNLPVRSEANLFTVSKAVSLFLPKPTNAANIRPTLVGFTHVKRYRTIFVGVDKMIIRCVICILFGSQVSPNISQDIFAVCQKNETFSFLLCCWLLQQNWIFLLCQHVWKVRVHSGKAMNISVTKQQSHMPSIWHGSNVFSKQGRHSSHEWWIYLCDIAILSPLGF